MLPHDQPSLLLLLFDGFAVAAFLIAVFGMVVRAVVFAANLFVDVVDTVYCFYWYALPVTPAIFLSLQLYAGISSSEGISKPMPTICRNATQPCASSKMPPVDIPPLSQDFTPKMASLTVLDSVEGI